MFIASSSVERGGGRIAGGGQGGQNLYPGLTFYAVMTLPLVKFLRGDDTTSGEGGVVEKIFTGSSLISSNNLKIFSEIKCFDCIRDTTILQ
jgi:hypothetical protein